MGCDVHMFAEKKVNGKWEKIGNVFKNQYYDPKRETTIDEDGYSWNAEFTDEPYDGRNYDLFAILADVRNGRGFAGIKTGEGFNPIAEPKGIPEDASDEYKAKCDDWDGDGHSHSYFTIAELTDYDWSQLTFKQGCVNLKEYKTLKDTGGYPESWSGMISGPNILVVDEAQADDMLFNGIPDGKEIYVMYRWGTLYSESCKTFLNDTIPALKELGDPNDVRIVFFFDN